MTQVVDCKDVEMDGKGAWARDRCCRDSSAEFGMNESARDQARKCKGKEVSDSANECKESQVSVQRTDANLEHLRTNAIPARRHGNPHPKARVCYRGKKKNGRTDSCRLQSEPDVLICG